MEQVLAKLETLECKLQGLTDCEHHVQSYGRRVLGELQSLDAKIQGLADGQRQMEGLLLQDSVSGAAARRNSEVAKKNSVIRQTQNMSNMSATWNTASRNSIIARRSVAGPKTSITGYRMQRVSSEDPHASGGETKDLQGFWQRQSLFHIKKTFNVNSTWSNLDAVMEKKATNRRGLQLAVSQMQTLKKWTSLQKRLNIFPLFPLHPDSWNRALFDFISVILLLYDSLVIPYQFAWPIPFQGWLAAVSWFTVVFWTVDMLLGFLTGYWKEEEIVMDIQKIGRHYLRKGFALNFFVVSVDVTGIVLEELKLGADMQVLHTVLKLLRFVKLERVMKLSARCRQGKVAQALDAVNTVMREKGLHEQFNIIVRVMKLVLFILWVNHVGCCFWHGLGSRAREKWLTDYSIADPAAMDNSFAYLLGLYWSACVMVSGGSIMIPTTKYELILVVFYVVFGFIFTSVLISSLLSTVIEYQDANKERHQRLTTLRQFLYQHKVGSKVATPIVKQARERLACRKRLSEGDVEALALLSPNIRSQLWHEIYGPKIAEHFYFTSLKNVDANIIRDMCFSALEHSQHASGDMLFQPREEAKGPYFVCYGTLEFKQADIDYHPNDMSRRSTMSVQSDNFAGAHSATIVVKKGAWISEVSIWVCWLHTGWLDVVTTAELLTVNSESLVKVISGHPKLINIAQSYARCLYTIMEQEPVGSLTDLRMPAAHSTIVAALPLPVRRKLSEGVFGVMMRNNLWTGINLRELHEEMQNGNCDLVLTSSEQVHRVVKIVGIWLVRPDGAVLVQIGRVTGGTRAARCQPPGTKVKPGEYPRQVLERLAHENLVPLAEHIEVGGTREDKHERASEKFGVSSVYMRTIYEAELKIEAEDYMHVLQRVPTTTRQPDHLQETTAKRRCCPCPRVWSRGDDERGGDGGSGGGRGVEGSRSTFSTSFSIRVAKTQSLRQMTRTFLQQAFGEDEGHQDPTAKLDAFVLKQDLESRADGGGLRIYSWVRPEDFETLCDKSAQEFLQRWMNELLIDDHDLEDSCSRGSSESRGEDFFQLGGGGTLRQESPLSTTKEEQSEGLPEEAPESWEI